MGSHSAINAECRWFWSESKSRTGASTIASGQPVGPEDLTIEQLKDFLIATGGGVRTMTEPIACVNCNGIGLVRVEADGKWTSQPCPCQEPLERAARVKRARIPDAFQYATLDRFVQAKHTVQALLAAKQFVREFLPGQPAIGLMLTGSVGTGKTHLAAGMVRELAEQKGVNGRFVDVRELLDKLRSSYDDNARETQAQILRPLLTADLVAIDELGAARPSDWVFETIELLIGGLYNRTVPVIVTTNLPNLGPGASAVGAAAEYARVVRPETLGDRIGARMWSRLQQMCRTVDMTGPDWRAKR
jgi:DNA replication protein DnaC